MKTNEFFIKGKLSIMLDGAAGSSGKGKIGAFLVKNTNNVDFVCNTFTPNASHTIVDGDQEFVYKQLNSCAHLHHKFEKMYIGHGAVINLEALFNEIEMSGLPKHKLGISPIAAVIQDLDIDNEMGKCSLDGEYKDHEGTLKTGTTCSGSGAARARKIMRKKNVLLARDIPELQRYMCDVPEEIIERLNKGQSGLLEIAQGHQLSYGLARFYPYCTSRNCTIAAGFDDMMLSPVYLGNVCINFRTFPIRIHSYKYIGKDGKHLTWDEVQEGKIPHNKIDSHSGEWYPDQTELTWDELTTKSGSPTKIMECTTLTKLPRRVATFSKINLKEAIDYNQTPYNVFISLNFVNYIDHDMYKVTDRISESVRIFLERNVESIIGNYTNVRIKYLGTSEQTDDTIILQG